MSRVRSAVPRSARPVTLLALIAVLLFAAAPATASNARSLDAAVQVTRANRHVPGYRLGDRHPDEPGPRHG